MVAVELASISIAPLARISDPPTWALTKLVSDPIVLLATDAPTEREPAAAEALCPKPIENPPASARMVDWSSARSVNAPAVALMALVVASAVVLFWMYAAVVLLMVFVTPAPAPARAPVSVCPRVAEMAAPSASPSIRYWPSSVVAGEVAVTVMAVAVIWPSST